MLTGSCIYYHLFFDVFKISDDIALSRDELVEFYNRLWRYGVANGLPHNSTNANLELTQVTDVPAVF
jgi:hypothetical protein